ncbi:fatty acid desaturase family protein [Thalassolituus oleivorans]|uniref:fatty acid desaturase family protein n=1 Tax=Thalassolituus oleivorans TaxID=187493 RepID=UPI0023F017C7|nr:fatty acid desaturase [Thalassolituus oleivorans]
MPRFTLPSMKLRYADALLPSFLLLVYITITYLSGFALMINGHSVVGWLFGILLLAHSMILIAYLIHDLSHQAFFMDRRANEYLGNVLSFLVGASYTPYADLRSKHMRHHVDRADVIAIDYRAFLLRHPLLLRVFQMAEWLYIPAIDILMHGLVIASPFIFKSYKALRTRVLIMLAIRIVLFAILAWTAWQALVGYCLAYVLFIHVLRLMDMHQHTYDVVVGVDEKGHLRPDADYERQNTYSNPLGNSRLINLLVLNFGYHNAHHEKPTAPWYRLPALHRELYGDKPTLNTFPIREVLSNLHRHRVARVIASDTTRMGGETPNFVGLYGVSFLTTI